MGVPNAPDVELFSQFPFWCIPPQDTFSVIICQIPAIGRPSWRSALTISVYWRCGLSLT